MELHGQLDRGDGVRLAWAHLPGDGPTVVFLPGYRSAMNGSKALAVQAYCAAHGRAALRLDYSGHGASEGDFLAGSIGRWTEDARLVLDHVIQGPMILIGSSMGGWIALLLARKLASRVAGLIGVAAAPDFTEALIWQGLAPSEQQALMRDGHLTAPSAYGDPYVITWHLIEEARSYLLLDRPIALTCPVRLLQGQQDPDVPWETALRIADLVESSDVRTVLVKDGDHRLSRPEDLAVLIATLDSLLTQDRLQA